MNELAAKIEAMRIFTEFGLTRLEWDLRNLDDGFLDWRPAPEANSVRWLLTHISMVLNVYLPRAFTGDLEYLPDDWPGNYLDEASLSMERILEDIEEGKVTVIKGFRELAPESLEDNLDWYIGDTKRETYLMILASEVLHHEGQVAALKGLKERMEGKPPKVVPPEA